MFSLSDPDHSLLATGANVGQHCKEQQSYNNVPIWYGVHYSHVEPHYIVPVNVEMRRVLAGWRLNLAIDNQKACLKSLLEAMSGR